MNKKITLIATVLFFSNLALAEAPTTTATLESGAVVGAEVVEAKATDAQIKALDKNLNSRLQSQLEQQMAFEFVPMEEFDHPFSGDADLAYVD
jgi:hypothetical protein